MINSAFPQTEPSSLSGMSVCRCQHDCACMTPLTQTQSSNFHLFIANRQLCHLLVCFLFEWLSLLLQTCSQTSPLSLATVGPSRLFLTKCLMWINALCSVKLWSSSGYATCILLGAISSFSSGAAPLPASLFLLFLICNPQFWKPSIFAPTHQFSLASLRFCPYHATLFA